MNNLAQFINEKLKLNSQSKLNVNKSDISKIKFDFYFTLDDYDEKEYYKEQFYNAFKKWPQKDLDVIHSIMIIYHEKYDGVTVAYSIDIKIGMAQFSIAFYETTDNHYEVTNRHNISKIDWLDPHNNLIECFVDQIHKDHW